MSCPRAAGEVSEVVVAVPAGVLDVRTVDLKASSRDMPVARTKSSHAVTQRTVEVEVREGVV